jgi:acyl-homoserine-lactone acylase
VGAGLVTNASVGIGHTEHFAWTDTVSTARRFGVFELTLDPADPTK